MEEKLETANFYYALHRPQEVLGGERELTLFSMLLAGALIFTGMSWTTTFIGGGIWMGCWWVLKKMAKADPIMSKVYITQLKYRPYYPPHSTPFAE